MLAWIDTESQMRRMFSFSLVVWISKVHYLVEVRLRNVGEEQERSTGAAVSSGCKSLQLWRRMPHLPLHTHSTDLLIPLQGGQRLQWKLCGTFGKAAPEMFSCCSWKGKAVAPVEKNTWGMVIKPTRSLNSRVLGDKFQLGITWTQTNLIWAEVDDSC